jgi:hypothetical protein
LHLRIGLHPRQYLQQPDAHDVRERIHRRVVDGHNRNLAMALHFHNLLHFS